MSALAIPPSNRTGQDGAGAPPIPHQREGGFSHIGGRVDRGAIRAAHGRAQGAEVSAPAITEVEKAADLERQIDQQALILHSAEKREDRVAAMEELRRLHALRSPEVVAEMEYERGLR